VSIKKNKDVALDMGEEFEERSTPRGEEKAK